MARATLILSSAHFFHVVSIDTVDILLDSHPGLWAQNENQPPLPDTVAALDQRQRHEVFRMSVAVLDVKQAEYIMLINGITEGEAVR